jgi:hypothetical protein
MPEQSPEPISQREERARLQRAESIARQLGFMGEVDYRHAFSRSGGAQYGIGPTIERDVLLVYAEAFQRDAAGDDFSLEAIIAHERGHQILRRHQRLRGYVTRELSAVTEEIVASLAGSLIARERVDRKVLVFKALVELLDRGVPSRNAVRLVANVRRHLRKIL